MKRTHHPYRIGDKVKKNPEKWIVSDYDTLGRGRGIGTVAAIAWDGDGRPYVDVDWNSGFAMHYCEEIIYTEENNG